MAEGLGEVVLGIRVDADQANAGLDRFKQSAIRAAQEASQALSRVGGGNTATIAPKLDLSSINEYAKRLASLDTSVDSPKIDLTSIREGIAEALELKRKIDQLDGLKAKASAEFIVTGLDSGNIANSLKNLQQALQAVGTTQVSVSIDSAEFKEATQQAVGLEQKLQDIEKRKAVITAEFILKGLQEGTITQSIANVRRELGQLNTAQVAVSVDSSDFVELGQRIAAEEQRLQRLENEQTKIKVQYLVEGLNDGQVTQSIQNLRQALQGLGGIQASVDVNSDDFVRITEQIAKLDQDLDQVDGRKAQITADFIIRGLDTGAITQSIANVRNALDQLERSQTTISVNSDGFVELGRQIAKEEQRLQALEAKQVRVKVEYLVEGLKDGQVEQNIQNLRQAIQGLENVQATIDVRSEGFEAVTQQIARTQQDIDAIDGRKALITANFLINNLNGGEIDRTIKNVQSALAQLNNAQVTLEVDSSDFQIVGQKIAQQEQQLQALEARQTEIKVRYLVEGLNNGEVLRSVDNLKQALQGIESVQSRLDVDSSDFVAATQDVARLQQDINRVDGRKAVITADFLIRGLNDGTISQSIGNVRKALEGLNNAQVVVDVDSTDFTQLGQAIVREEQRLQNLQSKQTVVRVQYLIEGINDGRVRQSIENIRQALQGIGQVQANLDVDSSDFVRATEDVTRLERRLADIDGRRAQISANFTVRGLDDGSITQSIGNVRSALQGLNNAQVAVRVDSQAFDELGSKIVREEQRLQRFESQQTEVRVKYLVQGLNDGQVTASLRNIQGLVQALDNQRVTLDINSPNLPTVIRQLQEAKQQADALSSKSLNFEVGSLRQGLQSGQVTNNTANLERFVGLLREQQRLLPLNSQAFGQLENEIQRYQRQLDGVRGVSGGAAGSVGLLQSAFLGLGAAFGVVSVVDIGRRIAEAGLNAETAAVRLRALTRAYGENSEATAIAGNAAKALGISQTEAENGISALYASLRPTGIGLKDIETIFLSFNAAARNSGSTAQEASNAFIQLKQALGKGSLNGDELRSIGEQAPLVAQAIAETLGVSVGKLRDLGAEGKITTDVILKSLERIKGAQLTQLGEQLDTGRQKLKDFQIAAEELGKDISSVLAPIGSEFLALATDFAKSLAGFNADPAKEKLQGIEAEVKRLQEVIELQKKLNLDTTDARKQLEELEKQLGNLNLQDANVQVANQAYEQRLKLVKQIREEEDKSRFGGRAQKLTVETAVSGIAQDPTGLLGKAFANLPKLLPDSPFKNLFGGADFSTRALEEGAKRVEEVFRKLASGQSLDGFSQNIKAGADEIKGLEDQIIELTRQQVELPIEAKVEREALQDQIKELESKLAQGRNRLKLQVELEVIDNQLKDVQGRLAKDPNNANLIKEFKDLELTQLRYRGAIQATTAENGKQDKGVQAFSNNLNELAEKLKAAEAELKGKRIFSVDFDQAIAKVEELRQELADVEGIKAKVTAQIILEGIDKGTVAASIGNFQQALNSLQTAQVSFDVRSDDFVKVTQDIAAVEAKIAEIDGFKAIITAEFILRGLEEGTITNSINNVRSALDQLNNARATINIDSPEFVAVTKQIADAQQRVDQLDGKQAKITLRVIEEGISLGIVSNSLNNLERRITALRTLQVTIPINSSDFQRVSSAIRGLQAQQQAAINGIRESTVSVGDALIAGSRQAAAILGDSVKGLRSALESGFKFLTADRQKQVLESARADIRQGIAAKEINPQAARRAEREGPESIISLSNISRNILEAANKNNQAIRDQQAANRANNANAPRSIERLVTTFINGVAEIQQIREPVANFDASVQQVATAPPVKNNAQIDFTPVVNSNTAVVNQLQANINALNALVNKDWSVSVNVNTDNGAATVSTISGLN